MVQKVEVFEFDNDGNVQEVLTPINDAIDVPFDDKVLSEPHLLELILDDRTQIEVYKINLAVIEGD